MKAVKTEKQLLMKIDAMHASGRSTTMRRVIHAAMGSGFFEEEEEKKEDRSDKKKPSAVEEDNSTKFHLMKARILFLSYKKLIECRVDEWRLTTKGKNFLKSLEK